MSEDNLYPDALFAIRGYRERISPKTGHKIIEIDFTADPRKDVPAWLERQYREAGENKTRREVLRDWTVAGTDAFYPEYANNGGRQVYAFASRAPGIAGVPVDRGWDFGMRKPACTWGQRGPEMPYRCYFHRELMIANIDTWGFMDIVRFLSGQIDESEMARHAYYAYQQAVEEGTVLPGPWYPRGTVFRDFAGPEIFRPSAQVKDGDPRSDWEILASKGIIVEAPRQEILDRVAVMRKLLYVGYDGKPGTLIHESCVNLHAMFNGGLAFPKPTAANPTPVKPHKDGHFDNIHDAGTYWVGQVWSLTGEEKKLVRRTVYNERREPIEIVEGDGWDSLGFYETRKRARGRR